MEINRDTYDAWRTECEDPWEQPCPDCHRFYEDCECDDE